MAGQRVEIHDALPHGMIGLRMEQFEFDDPNDWIISGFRVAEIEQLTESVYARDFATKLRQATTLQTRMPFSFVAYPQKNGLRFRCRITGEAV